MEKSVIRRKYKEKRNLLSTEELERISGIICTEVLKSEQYDKAAKIFTYINFGSEIITRDLINKAFSDKKTVAVPVVSEEKSKMIFLRIDSLAGLAVSSFGIPEPKFDENRVCACDLSTLVIVPMLAFNSQRYRIGYGGGYYDKFISENRALCFMGVCFADYLDDDLPIEDLDRSVDVIVTDRFVLK